MKSKKTWREKLATSKDLPKTMVIPAPSEVDALMKQVPKGRVVTINELRAALAAKHKVTFACPLTTGIFSWIAVHAAAEAEAEGDKRVTPYWRTLKTGGEINPKYPGGAGGVAKRLRAEGHKVISKGRRVFVADHENKLFTRLR
ncbi:MAG: MGMT family protein [Verrucomicrobia bacterium]|nr:MGMT family protein [Verrucomicrobiota bacterium]